jgi:hypothetical protein
MSAPDTDIKKQEKRHAGPLIGMAGGLLLAAILIFAFLSYQVDPVEDGEPEVIVEGVPATPATD